MMVIAVCVMMKRAASVAGGRRMGVDEVPALRRGQMVFKPCQHLR